MLQRVSDSSHKIILLVEDDLELNKLYQAILRDAGFLVQSITNGADALRTIKQGIPDLIILDVFLPKVSGFDILTELKKDPLLQKIPVIVLTNVYIDRQELLKHGIEHCLIKSEVTPDQVIEKIQQLLGETKAK